jgi:thioredoxin reductase (NADPH)
MSENVIIIGSGPAGLTAAIYCGRDNLNPLLITGIETGGQLELTTNVENFPAFPEGITGPDLMEKMYKHAEKFGTRFKNEYVTDIEIDTYPYQIRTSRETIEARSVIIATGSSAKWLGIASEKKFIGRGVSSCATCDAPFFKGKDVVVVGGGDTAMEDSLYLTNFARSVTIVHRRDAFRASRIMQGRVLSNPKVSVLWNSEVTEIKGDDVVKSVVIRSERKNETTERQIQGLFVAIGHRPNTDFLKGKLPLTELGYIITKDEVSTDYGGIFVAGDVADPKYKQAITAAGSGCKAALRVRQYFQEHS